MGRRPNLFILGGPRCGTTALFEFLGAHPDVHPASAKEPEFFVAEDERAPIAENDRTLEEYLDLFVRTADERWVLEGSTAYLSSRVAPRRIREFSPDARAIVMVRDPVAQLRSIHDLRVSLRWHKSLDLLTDVAADGDYYWKRVRAGENLARVLEVFPREDVHVVVHDDFKASNTDEYRRALEFLEIDPFFAPEFATVNPSYAPRSRTMQQALWGRGGLLRTVSRLFLPERARKRAFEVAASLNLRSTRPLDSEVAAQLWPQLEPDVELLSSLLERDLVSLWSREAEPSSAHADLR